MPEGAFRFLNVIKRGSLSGTIDYVFSRSQYAELVRWAASHGDLLAG